MGYPVTKNRMEDGGDRWVIGNGGKLEFEDGAEIPWQDAPVLSTGCLASMMPQRYTIAPEASGSPTVLAAKTLTSGSQNVADTSGSIVDPDVARCLCVTGGSPTVSGCVVITGTNIAGESITETIVASGTTTGCGVKAFATVENINLPARVTAGDSIAVGTLNKFGLPHILEFAEFVLATLFNGSSDSGSVTCDADELEKNVYACAGTPNGTAEIEFVYLK